MRTLILAAALVLAASASAVARADDKPPIVVELEAWAATWDPASYVGTGLATPAGYGATFSIGVAQGEHAGEVQSLTDPAQFRPSQRFDLVVFGTQVQLSAAIARQARNTYRP